MDARYLSKVPVRFLFSAHAGCVLRFKCATLIRSDPVVNAFRIVPQISLAKELIFDSESNANRDGYAFSYMNRLIKEHICHLVLDVVYLCEILLHIGVSLVSYLVAIVQSEVLLRHNHRIHTESEKLYVFLWDKRNSIKSVVIANVGHSPLRCINSGEPLPSLH